MLKRLFDKALPAIIASAVIAIVGGLLNMRVMLGSLETKTDAMSARLERIERHIDESENKLGLLDNE